MKRTGIAIVLSTAFALTACSNGGDPEPTGTRPPTPTAAMTVSPTISAPASVPAGAQFVLQGNGDTTFHQYVAVARGDTESWVLAAATAQAGPSAHRGDVTDDALRDPVASLRLAFDPATTPGEYELCATAGPADPQETRTVCTEITVEAAKAASPS